MVVVVVDVVGATMDDGVVVGDARISAISIETGAIEKTLSIKLTSYIRSDNDRAASNCKES